MLQNLTLVHGSKVRVRVCAVKREWQDCAILAGNIEKGPLWRAFLTLAAICLVTEFLNHTLEFLNVMLIIVVVAIFKPDHLVAHNVHLLEFFQLVL